MRTEKTPSKDFSFEGVSHYFTMAYAASLMVQYMKYL